MAYYGIPSAGLVLTASTANDTVAMANLGGGTTVTAASVYGADGNDIISLGAVGLTAVATSTISGRDVSGGLVEITASLVGSATYTNQASGNMTGGETMSVAVTGVITSQQAARIVNGAMFQANAGNDSIALGDRLSRVSATTLAGGAGNDIIGITPTSITSGLLPLFREPHSLPRTSKVATVTTPFTFAVQLLTQLSISMPTRATIWLTSNRL